MDKYEKEFVEGVKAMAKNMRVDRVELGELRLKRLAAMLYLLVKEKNEKFDLIVGGGNSGIFVQEVVKMVFKYAKLKIPPCVLFPIYRPSNQEGVKVTQSMVEKELSHIKNVKKVLFVDDEIMRGQTSKICFETIRDYLRDRNKNVWLRCTIVAENHNFVWRYDLNGVSVRFLPFAFVLQGYNCNFGFLMPEKTVSDMQTITGDPIDRNQAMALLLGGKRKIEKNNEASFVSEDELGIKDALTDYLKEKLELKNIFKKLVIAGINEYKNKLIEFKYLP